MFTKSALAALVLAAVTMTAGLGANPALAMKGSLPQAGAQEFGSSLPPIGYLQYCTENPQACTDAARSTDRLVMTPEKWDALFRVNRSVNTEIKPLSDQDQYGVTERWTMPVSAGDCEDYVLLKQRNLEELGFSSSSLLITVVLDENGNGHAVLTVATAEGDYILDNRRNDILRWTDTKYSFLKRQARDNGRHWVALAAQPKTSSGPVAAMPVSP